MLLLLRGLGCDLESDGSSQFPVAQIATKQELIEGIKAMVLELIRKEDTVYWDRFETGHGEVLIHDSYPPPLPVLL